ncbi:neuropeptide FF receptor 2-like [Oculina patagonica]
MENQTEGELQVEENLFSEPEYIKGIKVAAYCVIILTSLVGNSLIIAIVEKNYNHHMKTPNNFFVVNTAAADILITVSSATEAVITLALSSWLVQGEFGHALCKLKSVVMALSALVTTQSLATMAVDRFIVVFFPLRRIITRQVACGIIGIIWVSSIVFTVPMVFLASVQDFKGSNICYLTFWESESVEIYFVAIFVLFKCAPLVIQGVLYTAVMLKLCLRETPGNELHIPNHHHYHTEKMNRRIIAMLVAIVLLFAVCWLPLWIENMLCFQNFSNSICTSPDVYFLVWFLAYSKSAINPCIYFIFNETFRHGASTLWMKITHSRSRRRCNISLRHNRVTALHNRVPPDDTNTRSHPVNTTV